MFAEKRLKEIQEQKRLLTLEASVHRSLVRAEMVNARRRLSWLSGARQKAAAASPWLAVAGAVAGLFAARRVGGVAKWIPTALAALRWFQQAKSR